MPIEPTKNENGIQALLFDLGGVVIDFNLDLAFQYWAAHSPLSFEQIRQRFTVDEAYKKHERREINASTYFGYLRDLLRIKAGDWEIITGWNTIFRGVIKPTLQTIQSVRGKIPCFAFTNTNPTHQATWMKLYPEVVLALIGFLYHRRLG